MLVADRVVRKQAVVADIWHVIKGRVGLSVMDNLEHFKSSHSRPSVLVDHCWFEELLN